MLNSYFLSALAAYFGGKRSLLPWIMRQLIQVVPRSDWPELSFIDLFMGGGSVSLTAKASGFRHIHSNDWALRAQIIGAALLTNDHIRLTRQDLLFLNQALPEGHPSGLAETLYSPSVFSKRHAQALDCWLYWTSQIQDETKQALCKLLIWHCIYQFICIPTSVNTSNRPFAEALDGLRSWDTLNPKRFQDKSLDSLLKPTFQCLSEKMPIVNKGVFGGSLVSLYQQDAITLLQQLEGDILYADPPYSQTMRYEKAFTVIDHLLTGQTLEQTSTFSQSTQSLDDLFDHARHIPTWVLSYGNKTIDLAGLADQVQRHAGACKVVGFAKRYQHMPHVSKNTHNQELLIIASPEREVISYAR